MRLINADAVIEILKGNKQFFIDAWGGSFHAMSEKAKARYDEIDNCIAIILNAPTIEPDGDTISRQGAINAIENTDCELTTKDWDELTGALKSLPSAPSAEAESRLYIKIYADDEPSIKAEKLYQICGETQNREVTEWLKEYFPSAPDSQQRGEWVEENEEDYDYERAIDQIEYDILYEPTYNPEDGSL